MSYILGESVNVGFGFESVRGTVVSPQIWIPGRTPSGVRPALEKVLVAETRVSRVTSQGSEITQSRIEGDLEFNVKSCSIGYILRSLLGEVSSQGVIGNAGVYQHDFSILLNNPENPSLSVGLSQPTQQDYSHALVLPTSLEISTPVDDLVNATTEFIGKAEAEVSDYTVSFPSDDYYFRNHDVTIKIADDVASLAGASAIGVKEFSLSMVNNGRVNQNIEDFNPSNVLALLMEITGSMMIDYQDDTYHDIFKNGSYKAMEIKMVRSDITIGVDQNPTIQITLPKISFEDLTPERPIDDILMDSIEFTAHYDEDEASAIDVQIINECEEYAPASAS